MKTMETSNRRDFERIERAIRFLLEHWPEHPDLERVARAAGVSRFHFDRMFRRWAGISPMRFLKAIALEHGKQLLARGRSVLSTSLDIGLSGPSRLHDLFVTIDAVTPGEFKARGRGLRIGHGVHPSPFGPCLVGRSPRGVCWLSFADAGRTAEALSELRAAWPEAELVPDEDATRAVVRRAFDPHARNGGAPVPLHVRGTNFQVKVWSALLRIPPGSALSYGDVAEAIGRPRAARAVGAALGANPVAVLIPCHRVIVESGSMGEYRFGADRKRALLAWESARLR